MMNPMQTQDSSSSPHPGKRGYRWPAAILLLLLIGVVGLLATHHLPVRIRPGQNNAAQNASLDPHRILYWYDPMHPGYTSNKPGIAPDCGMQLVPRYADEGSSKTVPGTITVPDDKQSLAGVRTVSVTRDALSRDIHTSAVIVPDESRISHVHVKFSGVLEQVFANITGQFVRRGQPLFTIYSPDLLATEDEYLIAKRGQATLAHSSVKDVAQSSQSLLEAARQRLTLWDISEDQIRQLDQTGKPLHALTIYSPVSGYITERKAIMDSAVTADTDLYTISDLSSVWALVDIFEDELPYVHLGQHVTLSFSYEPGKSYSGAISQIFPGVDPQTRTVKARVQLANPGTHFKPQMYADATIHVSYGNHIAVPRDAVLDSGQQQQVFVVQPGGSFVPRKVTLGPSLDDRIIILDGLQPGETIVASGNFLIDSESRLKGAPETSHGARP